MAFEITTEQPIQLDPKTSFQAAVGMFAADLAAVDMNLPPDQWGINFERMKTVTYSATADRHVPIPAEELMTPEDKAKYVEAQAAITAALPPMTDEGFASYVNRYDRGLGSGIPRNMDMFHHGLRALEAGHFDNDRHRYRAAFLLEDGIENRTGVEKILAYPGIDSIRIGEVLHDRLVRSNDPWLLNTIRDIQNRQTTDPAWMESLRFYLARDANPMYYGGSEYGKRIQNILMNFSREPVENHALLLEPMDYSIAVGTPLTSSDIAVARDKFKYDVFPDRLMGDKHTLMSQDLLEQYLWMGQHQIELNIDEQNILLESAIYHRMGVREALDAQTNPERTGAFLAELLLRDELILDEDHIISLLDEYEEQPPWLASFKTGMSNGRARTTIPERETSLGYVEQRLEDITNRFPRQTEWHKKARTAIGELENAIRLRQQKGLFNQKEVRAILEESNAGRNIHKLNTLLGFMFGTDITLSQGLSDGHLHFNEGIDIEVGKIYDQGEPNNPDTLNLDVTPDVLDIISRNLGEYTLSLRQGEIQNGDFHGASIPTLRTHGDAHMQNCRVDDLSHHYGYRGNCKLTNVKARDFGMGNTTSLSMKNTQIGLPVSIYGGQSEVDDFALNMEEHSSAAFELDDLLLVHMSQPKKHSTTAFFASENGIPITTNVARGISSDPSKGIYLMYIPQTGEAIQKEPHEGPTRELANMQGKGVAGGDFDRTEEFRFQLGGEEFIAVHALDLEIGSDGKTQQKEPLKAVFKKVVGEDDEVQYVFAGVWDGSDRMRIDGMDVPVGEEKATPVSNMWKLFGRGKPKEDAPSAPRSSTTGMPGSTSTTDPVPTPLPIRPFVPPPQPSAQVETVPLPMNWTLQLSPDHPMLDQIGGILGKIEDGYRVNTILQEDTVPQFLPLIIEQILVDGVAGDYIDMVRNLQISQFSFPRVGEIKFIATGNADFKGGASGFGLDKSTKIECSMKMVDGKPMITKMQVSVADIGAWDNAKLKIAGGQIKSEAQKRDLDRDVTNACIKKGLQVSVAKFTIGDKNVQLSTIKAAQKNERK